MIDFDSFDNGPIVDPGESGSDFDRGEDDAFFSRLPLPPAGPAVPVEQRLRDDPAELLRRLRSAQRKITTEAAWLERIVADLDGDEPQEVRESLMRAAWCRLRLVEAQAKHAARATKTALGPAFGADDGDRLERFRGDGEAQR